GSHGEARPAGDQPRGHPRLGRNAAARAGVRRRVREGADPDWPPRRRGGGGAPWARERRVRGRGAAGAGARDGAPVGREEPARARVREGGGEPRAAGLARGGAYAGGVLLRHALLVRGPEGGHG